MYIQRIIQVRSVFLSSSKSVTIFFLSSFPQCQCSQIRCPYFMLEGETGFSVYKYIFWLQDPPALVSFLAMVSIFQLTINIFSKSCCTLVLAIKRGQRNIKLSHFVFPLEFTPFFHRLQIVCQMGLEKKSTAGNCYKLASQINT